jgi:hypothetical protein
MFAGAGISARLNDMELMMAIAASREAGEGPGAVGLPEQPRALQSHLVGHGGRTRRVPRKPAPPEFVTWKAIMERGCCTRWRCYANFRRDVGRRPTWAHLLIRRDVTREFSPGNAHWQVARWYRRWRVQDFKADAAGQPAHRKP